MAIVGREPLAAVVGLEHVERPRVSVWLLVGMLIAGAAISLTAHMNVDPDLYWHRVLGAHWLDTGRLDTSSDPISFTDGRAWFPTAWSVEVLYALLAAAVGYSGIFALRLILALAFYVLLARFLFASGRAPVAALVLGVVGLPAALVIQDRPQTLSLVILCALLPAISRALHKDLLPPFWVIAFVTWGWANIHGMWVIIPGLLALLTIARLSTHANATWRDSSLALVASLIAASLTPVGPRLLVSPFSISQATGAIAEWAPTALRAPVSWGFAGCLAALLLSWSRCGHIPVREVLYTFCVAAFGFLAYRNAVVASLLLTPVVLPAIERGFLSLESHILLPRRAVPLLGSVLLMAIISSYLLHAALPSQMPAKISRYLASEERELRVVTPYNSSGYVREFGGDKVRVSIDGRADRYGADRIDEHGDLMAARKGWRISLQRLDPDRVIVERSSPLLGLLKDEGWHPIMRENGFVLLAPA